MTTWRDVADRLRGRWFLRFAAPVIATALAAACAVVVLQTRDEKPGEPAAAALLPPPAATARVTVDAARDLGVFANPGWYHNQADHISPLAVGDLQRVHDLRPRVTRAWLKPNRYYDPDTRTYNFDYDAGGGSSTHDYIAQVSSYADEIVINLDQCDRLLMVPPREHECAQVLEVGLEHYKRMFPKVRYVELFNEPDKTWPPQAHERPAVAVADYYRWYRVGYQAVNAVNERVTSGVPLLLGGPAAYTFNPPFIQRFLDLYRSDEDPAKRLDFLSYHQYRARANPAVVRGEKATVRTWLSARRLNPETPVFVTEYGVFPGDNWGTTFDEDLLTHMSAMATLSMSYVAGGTDKTFHWVFRHPTNPRKSMFVDEVDGAVYPYYNLVRMQLMLKERQLASSSDALTSAGIGVNALATADDSGVAVLTTNYQWTKCADHTVEVSVERLPPAYASGRIRVERYLVDAAHSNYVHDPQRDDLQPVEDREIDAARMAVVRFPLGCNATALVVLTPLG
jgi:hypothetical protein